MIRPSRTPKRWFPDGQTQPSPFGLKLASALIGRTVDIVSSANSIAHGVVTGVLLDAGKPKLVVAGVPYDLNRVLTAIPTPLN